MSLPERKKKEKTTGLFEKIQKIQSDAEQTLLDSKVTIGSRTFMVASLDSVLDTYLPLLKKHHIAMVLIGQEILPPALPNNFIMNSRYSLVDIDSGESHEFNIHSNGNDGNDKATGKAASYALKIAFLQIFCGRRGDDPDTANNEKQKSVKSKSEPDVSKSEPPADDKPKPREGVPPDESPLAKACNAIKRKFDITDIANTQRVPEWKEVDEFAKSVGTDQATVNANIGEFARYWWLCCHVTGSKDLAKVEGIYKKAKAKLTVKQREAIEGMIAKRRSAEREPGQEG